MKKIKQEFNWDIVDGVTEDKSKKDFFRLQFSRYNKGLGGNTISKIENTYNFYRSMKMFPNSF